MRALVLMVVSGLVLVAASGCNTPRRPGCVRGASQVCACPPDGRMGAQTCSASGTFDPCVCAPAIDASRPDAALPDTGPACGAGGPCVDAATPDTGSSLDAGGPADAARADAGVDAGSVDAARADAALLDSGTRDAGSATAACSMTGQVGSNCRAGLCTAALTCGELPTGMTVQDLFMVQQGTLSDPAHPDYQGIETPRVPSHAAPFNGLSGSMCMQVCDTTAAVDGCGTCATCSGILTQVPVVNALGGALQAIGTADRLYGADSGLCRLDCTFDPSTSGAECVTGQTCDAFTETCIERCTSDTECNTLYGATYSGEFVTVLATDDPATCNTRTGRCERMGTTGAAVGDACVSNSDCAPNTGICLNGGMCGELGCSGTTCGVGGVCLGINDHATLCIAGCNSALDCDPGNACQLLGASVGGFAGYCLATCVDDSECRATETCNDDPVAGTAGTCVPRCGTPDGVGAAAGCTAGEYCRRDHAGATYGFCRLLGGFCDVESGASVSSDCGAAEICDDLLATGGGAGFGGMDVFGDGHCAPRCTSDASCTGRAGPRCVLTGTLAGLCRTPCTTTCVSAAQRCDTTLGYCVER